MHNLHLPSPRDVQKAAAAHNALRRLAPEAGNDVEVSFSTEHADSEKVILPREVFETLLEILRHTQRGRAVTLIPIHAELTTQQAAELLNVSRPYVIKLLDEGKMRFHMVGKHRRVRAENLFEYKKQMDMESIAAADALSLEAQESGLDYGKEDP